MKIVPSREAANAHITEFVGLRSMPQYRQWAIAANKENARIRQRILDSADTQRCLKKLTKAGANRENILELLTLIAFPRNPDFWRPLLKRKKSQLESMERQLRTVANHAERISKDIGCLPEFWRALLGYGKWSEVALEKGAPLFICGPMRLYANECQVRSKALGELLTQTRRGLRDAVIDYLLIELASTTQKCFDKEVACLLTNVSAIAGRDALFSAEQVKKRRQRRNISRNRALLSPHFLDEDSINKLAEGLDWLVVE